MAFEILRKYFMEGDEDKLKETEKKISDEDELYNFLCAFYTECEVKGVDLHYKSRKFIIRYVVKYRLNYANKNATKNETDLDHKESNKEKKRINLLKEILSDHKENQNLNPIESITFLKTVVKVIEPLIFNKNTLRIPWEKIQFVICIFIATNTDKDRLPDWLLDNYYQLMVSGEFIAKLLRLLMARLEGMGKEAVDWSELDVVFNISKMYYLVMKMNWRYQHFDYDSKETIKTNYLQSMGECFSQLKKLNYVDFEDSSYMKQKMNLFSTILVNARNKIAHSHEISYFKVNTANLGLLIVELIQIVRSKIEERILNEFQTLLAISVDKLLYRVNEITITIFSKKKINILDLYKIIDQILKSMENQNNLTIIRDIGNKLKRILSPQRYLNKKLFNFIDILKRNSKILKNEPENSKLSIDVITAQLNQLSPPPFVNIKMLVDLFLGLIPDSQKKKDLEKRFNSLNTDYLKENLRQADDENFIQYIIFKIEKCIKDYNDKIEFTRKVSELMKKRYKIIESKIVKDSISDKIHGNDLLQSIIQNKNKNLSDEKIVEEFLKDWKDWKNIQSVVDKIPGEETIDQNLITGPFAFYNAEIEEWLIESVTKSFGLMQKSGANLSFDFNFFDFDCPIPVGRNLRNYLAHGDVSVDVLCPDIRLVIQNHYMYLEPFDQSQKSLGFTRPDDFNLVKNNFMKQMRWAREAWELLNWNNDIKVLEKYESDPLSFKVRDPSGLTIVHYSLKEINENNEFLNFLMRGLENKYSTQDDLFKKLLAKYITPNYFESTNQYCEIYKDVVLNYNSVSFHINKLNEKDMALTLAQIICYNCPNLEIFESVFSIIQPILKGNSYCGLLQIAVAQNHAEIVTFLLKQDSFKYKINSEYKDFTALEYAIMNDNFEIAEMLINNGANIKTDQVLNIYKGDELPLSLALENCDFKILSLLKPNKEMKLDNNFFYVIQQKINLNLNPKVWTCILNSFCESKKDFEMFLYIACLSGKLDIVKTILETKSLDWSCIKETILMSCYNLKSPEFIEYLLEKEAALKIEHLKLICTFGSTEIVKYLIRNDYLKDVLKLDLIGRNKTIVQALLNADCKIDWKAVDFIALQFIQEQNLPEDFLKEQILNFVMLSSRKEKYDLIKYYNKRGICIPVYVLKYAAMEFGIDECKYLKECQFEETPHGWTDLLVTAVRCNHYLLARLALENKADINISIDEKTLLEFIIDKNSTKVTEIMKLLSEYKCPSRFGIDFSNFTHQDELLYGHLTKNKEMIKNAEEKADLDYKYSNFRDGTILHIKSHYGIKFKTKKRKTSIKNLDNCTSYNLLTINYLHRLLPLVFLQISPFQRLIAGILRSNFKIMDDALKSGADINSVVDHYNSFSPLHVAVRENLTKVVEYLLNQGSNPFQKDSYQKLPIDTFYLKRNATAKSNAMAGLLIQHMNGVTNDVLKIAQHWRDDVVKVQRSFKQYNLKTILDFESALESGLNINSVPNECQESYLDIACCNSNFDLVKFLLENGADPLVENRDEKLPIDIAVVKDDNSIVELFLNKDLQSYNLKKLLKLAFKSNSLKSIEILLQNGAVIYSGFFHYPCKIPNNNGLELAKILLKIDEYCNTLCDYFFVAVDNCNYVMAKFILLEASRRSNINLYVCEDFEMALEKGININQSPLDNKIPYLHYATFCCESKVVEFLLKNGANPFLQHNETFLPIDYAIKLDDVEKVKLLFEGQPVELKDTSFTDRNEINSYNFTSLLLYAFKFHSFKSVQFLITNKFREIKEDPNVIEVLLERACDLNFKKGLQTVKYILENDLKPLALDLKELLKLSKEKKTLWSRIT